MGIWRFEHLSNYTDIIHFVSTRDGGNSRPPFDTLNLAFMPGESDEVTRINRLLLAQEAGFNANKLTVVRQVHGSKILNVTAQEVGRGSLWADLALAGYDALVTQEREAILVVQTADCVPVLLYDTKTQTVAAIHSGWQGTAKQIVRHTIELMERVYGSKPKNIVAGIAPAIGKCCYEVQEDLRRYFADFPAKNIWETRKHKLYLDLNQANRELLIACGVQPENIEMSNLCTACHTERFYSYRANAESTGRFFTGIGLRRS